MSLLSLRLFRLFGLTKLFRSYPRQPSVAFDSVVELLLYAWQYEKNIYDSAIFVQTMAVVFTGNENEEYKEPLSKVITDETTARRLSRNICNTLVHKITLDTELSQALFLLRGFLGNNEMFALSRGCDYFKSIAIALQKQLCCGIERGRELHKLRICNGCWKALYCERNCQKR